jgi:hypothetical protein
LKYRELNQQIIVENELKQQDRYKEEEVERVSDKAMI